MTVQNSRTAAQLMQKNPQRPAPRLTQAMENYRARGFRLFKEESALKDVPPLPADETGWYDAN